MQQQLMHQHQHQQSSSVAGSFNSNVTTDHIQQYLNENKALILKILENQNAGKLGECAENQARLQRNLMYLAAVADCQPQPSSIYMQPGMNYTQHQQSQPMGSQSHMAGQSSIMYAQHNPYSALQQQHALHSQLALSSTGTSGVNTLRSEVSLGGGGAGAFPDFGRSMSGEGLQGVSRLPPRSRNDKNGSTGSDEDRGSNSRKQGKLNSETN